MRANISEYKAIEDAAMKFVKSIAEGNSTYAKELFVNDAVLFGYLDGNARIDIVSVEETVAVVRVLEEKWGGRIDFTDYLLLLKLGEDWKCVAKVYNQNSNTIQK